MRQRKLLREMLVDIPGFVNAGCNSGLEKIDTGLPRLRFKRADESWGTPKRAKNGAFEIDFGDAGR
jgi:hypothetical protein